MKLTQSMYTYTYTDTHGGRKKKGICEKITQRLRRHIHTMRTPVVPNSNDN